ncbi:unnamed protein product [Effrenium voratum]|uniref:Uncharacterized protein n=1 Tax=Effrenium voratum TaxID=2562239 RepID=A0AA36JGZ1_9DINO|nr:unnamed protein product [Effrenium voratum]
MSAANLAASLGLDGLKEDELKVLATLVEETERNESPRFGAAEWLEGLSDYSDERGRGRSASLASLGSFGSEGKLKAPFLERCREILTRAEVPEGHKTEASSLQEQAKQEKRMLQEELTRSEEALQHERTKNKDGHREFEEERKIWQEASSLQEQAKQEKRMLQEELTRSEEALQHERTQNKEQSVWMQESFRLVQALREAEGAAQLEAAAAEAAEAEAAEAEAAEAFKAAEAAEAVRAEELRAERKQRAAEQRARQREQQLSEALHGARHDARQESEAAVQEQTLAQKRLQQLEQLEGRLVSGEEALAACWETNAQCKLCLEDEAQNLRTVREEWRSERCSLRGQLRQRGDTVGALERRASELEGRLHRSEDLLQLEEAVCNEVRAQLRESKEQESSLEEEVSAQQQVLDGGLRRAFEEQKDFLHCWHRRREELWLSQKVEVLESAQRSKQLAEVAEQRELEMQRGQQLQSFPGLEERLQKAEALSEEAMELRKNLAELRLEEAAQARAKYFFRTEAEVMGKSLEAERHASQQQEERRRCDWQAQQLMHEAGLTRLTERHEKALAKMKSWCDSEKASLQIRFEKEREEWAVDWLQLHAAVKPLLRGQEVAEAELVSRQVAAEEGVGLFRRFAQLKELQVAELKQANRVMESFAERGHAGQAHSESPKEPKVRTAWAEVQDSHR